MTIYISIGVFIAEKRLVIMDSQYGVTILYIVAFLEWSSVNEEQELLMSFPLSSTFFVFSLLIFQTSVLYHKLNCATGYNSVI